MDEPAGKPLVSVILPTYNSPEHLAETIKSVLRQSYGNFELIIVDDGSAEETGRVLAGITDPRVRVIRHPENYGVAKAYNTGVAASGGEFIGFIGSDDAWAPDLLKETLECFSTLPPEFGVVYCDMWAVDPGKNQYYWHSPDMNGPDIVNRETADFQASWLGNGPALFRRACFDRAGLFDEQFRCHVDLDLFIRVSQQFRFFHLEKPLYFLPVAPGDLQRCLRFRYCETAADKKIPGNRNGPAIPGPPVRSDH